MDLPQMAGAKGRMAVLAQRSCRRFCSKPEYRKQSRGRCTGVHHLLRRPQVQQHRAVLSQAKQEEDEDQDELPWVRTEKLRAAQEAAQQEDLPFGVYLTACVISAIVTIGSMFEIANGKPVFNLVSKDSPFWLPILSTFIVLGAPTSAFCGVRGVRAANAEFERLDRLDGEK